MTGGLLANQAKHVGSVVGLVCLLPNANFRAATIKIGDRARLTRSPAIASCASSLTRPDSGTRPT